VTVALAQRLVLMGFMAGVWLLVGAPTGQPIDFHAKPGHNLPALTTPAEQLIFGVWRRWDAVHYYRLALYGYTDADPGATVFGVLTPLGFRAFDALLPGGIDLAALFLSTAAFALALACLYRLCETYYADPELAPWAVCVTAVWPLAHFFSAPMSESIYLALALGLFYFAARGRWLWAGVCGLLATLARSQGALLVGIGALLLVESWLTQPPIVWRERLRGAVFSAWPLALIPLGILGFEVFRQNQQLPPVAEVYADHSYVFFVNPLEGLLINLRWIAEHPRDLLQPDLAMLLVTLVLALVMLTQRAHRRLALVAYTFGFLLVFVSKINWAWGTDDVTYTQSYARYALVLFPLFVLVADGLRRAPAWGRIAGAGALGLLMLLLSAAHVLALAGP
jgi:hypothetical protein